MNWYGKGIEKCNDFKEVIFGIVKIFDFLLKVSGIKVIWFRRVCFKGKSIFF